MNLTQTTALKWTFYALAAAALFFLRRLLLGSMTFFGVIPFLPPVILAVMASFELPRSAVIAGIVFGGAILGILWLSVGLVLHAYCSSQQLSVICCSRALPVRCSRPC